MTNIYDEIMAMVETRVEERLEEDYGVNVENDTVKEVLKNITIDRYEIVHLLAQKWFEETKDNYPWFFEYLAIFGHEDEEERAERFRNEHPEVVEF